MKNHETGSSRNEEEVGPGALEEGLDCDRGKDSPHCLFTEERTRVPVSISMLSESTLPCYVYYSCTAPSIIQVLCMSWNHSWDSPSLAGAFFILQVSGQIPPPPLKGYLPTVILRHGTLLIILAECMKI